MLEKGRGIIFRRRSALHAVGLSRFTAGRAVADRLHAHGLARRRFPGGDGTTVQLTPESAEEPIFQLADTSAESRKVWENLPLLYWVLETEKRKSAQVMVEAVDARKQRRRPAAAGAFPTSRPGHGALSHDR